MSFIKIDVKIKESSYGRQTDRQIDRQTSAKREGERLLAAYLLTMVPRLEYKPQNELTNR